MNIRFGKSSGPIQIRVYFFKAQLLIQLPYIKFFNRHKMREAEKALAQHREMAPRVRPRRLLLGRASLTVSDELINLEIHRLEQELFPPDTESR